MSVRAALEALDLSAVMAAVLDQEAHGHTAESDAELPLDYFASLLVSRSQAAADVMRSGGGQRLDIAYNRCAREAALCLAIMRRIKRDQEQGRAAA